MLFVMLIYVPVMFIGLMQSTYILQEWFSGVGWNKMVYISMGQCKKDVTPLLTHSSYVFLALTRPSIWCRDMETLAVFTRHLWRQSGDCHHKGTVLVYGDLWCFVCCYPEDFTKQWSCRWSETQCCSCDVTVMNVGGREWVKWSVTLELIDLYRNHTKARIVQISSK